MSSVDEERPTEERTTEERPLSLSKGPAGVGVPAGAQGSQPLRGPSTSSGGVRASPEDTSPTGHAPRTERQAIGYCPYCSEENLFPLEGGGWECRSCLRAFSVTFRGLVSPSRHGRELR